VDDSLGMRRIQRVGNFNGEVEHLVQRQRLARNAELQRLAFHEFHDDEWMAAVLADLVDSANTGMIQRRGCARFAAEALEGLRILGNIIGQELQSDESSEFGVLGL